MEERKHEEESRENALCLNIPFCILTTQTFELLTKEGILAGASSGLNVAAAVKVAQQLGPGHTIVTLVCDRSVGVKTSKL